MSQEQGAHDSEHSQLRELIVEHLFIGELLRLCWRRKLFDVEVLRSETDAFGYDLILERAGRVRHIQLKSVKLGGKTSEWKVSLGLLAKPGGCVICIVVGDDDLSFDHFLWFGDAQGKLPDIQDLKVAKHSKANAEGVKLERSNHRVVRRGKFKLLRTMDEVLTHLFN